MIGLTFFQVLIICLFCCLLGIFTFFLAFSWFVSTYADSFDTDEDDYNDAK